MAGWNVRKRLKRDVQESRLKTIRFLNNEFPKLKTKPIQKESRVELPNDCFPQIRLEVNFELVTYKP